MIPLPLVLLLAACHPQVVEDTGPEGPIGPTPRPDIVLVPDDLSFGEVDLVGGDPPTQEFGIRNDGDGALHILSVVLDDPWSVFSVSTPAYLVVEPGTSTSVRVSFAPLEGTDYTASIAVSSDDPDEPVAEVSLSGTGHGGAITANPDPIVFTDTLLGCTDETVVTLTNTGGGILRLASIEILPSEGEMAISEMPVLPPTLAPGGSVEVGLAYTPEDPGSDSGLLQVFLQHVDGPFHQVNVGATAAVASWGTDTFVWSGIGVVDILLAFDRSSSMYYEYWYLYNALSSFMSALDAAALDWRFSVTVEDDGCINGPPLWIDTTYSTTQARAALGDMVHWAGSGVCNHQAFTLLQATVNASVPKGCNEGLLRDDATWHLAGLSDQREQSKAPYSEYVAWFQSLRPNPSYVIFDAIGGPSPSGCATAEYYSGMYEAVEATGGTFISICTSDWSTDLESWAADIAASASGELLRLSSAPVPGTITVAVDGVEQTDGWWWDATMNAVSFDKGAEPATGATVEIAYAQYGDCA
ncbi:MAG: choice-of-anchor D domain-containing protein [Deltaproteobacteria bacterium]|nr:choice-of-anchor D domain-containing protein [Deltaproteobacteria bacterium]